MARSIRNDRDVEDFQEHLSNVRYKHHGDHFVRVLDSPNGPIYLEDDFTED